MVLVLEGRLPDPQLKRDRQLEEAQPAAADTNTFTNIIVSFTCLENQ